MSIRVTSRVWDQLPYEGNDLLVILALADFADDDGNAWPSYAALAAKARCSTKTVQRTIARAEKDGYLAVTRGSGRGNRTAYRVVVAALPSVVATQIKPDILSPLPEAKRGHSRPEKGTFSTGKGDICGSPNKEEPSENRQRTTNAREPKPKKAPGFDLTGFGEWWAIYPRRVAKGAAERAWRATSAHCNEALRATIMAATVRFGLEMRREQRPMDKIAHPATWLNARRWEDEYPTVIAQPAPKPRTPEQEAAEEAEISQMRKMQEFRDLPWPHGYFCAEGDRTWQMKILVPLRSVVGQGVWEELRASAAARSPENRIVVRFYRRPSDEAWRAAVESAATMRPPILLEMENSTEVIYEKSSALAGANDMAPARFSAASGR